MEITTQKKNLPLVLNNKDREKKRVKIFRKKNKATHKYVDNTEFLKAIIDYKKDCLKAKREKREKPVLSAYLGECIFKIAHKMASAGSFASYSFKEEMISDGIENCIMYFDNFNPKKYQNPFGYFSQIMAHAFVRRIAKEEKQKYTTYKHYLETTLLAGHQGLMVSEDGNTLQKQDIYDNISSFMNEYETKERKKKLAREEKLAKKEQERISDRDIEKNKD